MLILFIIMAVIEIGAGAALILAPSAVSSILLGARFEGATGSVVARLAGVALISLGIACWLARVQPPRAALATLCAMLTYNLGAAAVLAAARIGFGLGTVILWPIVVVHVLLAAWCGGVLRRVPRSAV